MGVGDGGSGPAPRATTDGTGPFASAFPPGVASKLGWYVYLLVDPGSGRAFYVGRGRGDRCFRHVLSARAAGQAGDRGPEWTLAPARIGGIRPTTMLKGRELPVLGRINEIEAASGPVRVEILRYGLDADEARLVEVAAHDALGLQLDPKLGSQRQLAAELGLRLAKRAKFKRDHQVVLLQVGGQGARQRLRERPPRVAYRETVDRPLLAPVAPVGDHRGRRDGGGHLRIEAWEPTPVPGRPDRDGSAAARARARSSSRYSFVGVRDDELDRRYAGTERGPSTSTPEPPGPRRIAAEGAIGPAVPPGPAMGPPRWRSRHSHRGQGPVGQVTYVWCGPRWESGPRLRSAPPRVDSASPAGPIAVPRRPAVADPDTRSPEAPVSEPSGRVR